MAGRAGSVRKHPYDLGVCGNLHTILGPNPATWLVPGLSAHGDGLSHTTAWEHVRDPADRMLGL